MKKEKSSSHHPGKDSHAASCSSGSSCAVKGNRKTSGSHESTKTSSKSEKHRMETSDDTWMDSFGSNSGPSYREMNLSLSRMVNGEQTDIRIHRETGHPTDIYVSQGSESWSLEPSELDQLPEELREEVEMLLSPPEEGKNGTWITFLIHEESPGEEECLLSGCGCR